MENRVSLFLEKDRLMKRLLGLYEEHKGAEESDNNKRVLE